MLTTTEAAKLAAVVADKMKNLECGDLSTENLCGMKDTCGWANGVCSEPTLIPPDFFV